MNCSIGYRRLTNGPQPDGPFRLDVVARDEPTKRNVKLSPGGSIHDPTDPVGRLLFNVLARSPSSRPT